MRKLISQDGARVRTGWPLTLHRYEAGSLPDPADVIDCPLIVNDRTDGVPRGRIVISNGASYDDIAYLTDIPAGAPQVSAPSLPPLPVAVPAPNVAAEVARQVAALQPVVQADPALAARVEVIEQRLAECERVIDEFIGAAKMSKQLKDRI
jgi:hypothetical protein